MRNLFGMHSLSVMQRNNFRGGHCLLLPVMPHHPRGHPFPPSCLTSHEATSAKELASTLKVLQIDPCKLKGPIPAEAGHLVRLTVLNLPDNTLEGAFRIHLSTFALQTAKLLPPHDQVGVILFCVVICFQTPKRQRSRFRKSCQSARFLFEIGRGLCEKHNQKPTRIP